MISVLQERSDTFAGASGTIVLAFTNPVTAGSSIHVCVKSSGSPTSFTCADDVNGAYTPVGSLLSDAGGGHRGQQFIRDGAGAGTTTVTVAISASVTTRSILIREIGGTSGYDVQASQRQGSASPGTDAATSGLATPSVAPGLVSGAFVIHVGPGDGLTVGTGFGAFDVHPLTNWGFIDSASEHLRYTSAVALAATAT